MTRPIDKLLPLLTAVEKVRDNEWKSYCPVHEADGQAHDPSFNILEKPDGTLLLHCFVCGSKGPQFAHAVGLAATELFGDYREKVPGQKPRAGGKPKRVPRVAKKTADYYYRDEGGAVVFRACRWEWAEDGKKFKEFTCQRPNGEGGWLDGIKGLARPLYRLPELLAADPAATVFIVEGEKKVERLAEWGLVATCNVGGANARWNHTYTDWLVGRHVVILPDNDPPNEKTGERVGHAHALKIYRALLGQAASAKIVDLPGLPPKGDVVDWIDAGGTLPQFLQIVAATTCEEVQSIHDRVAEEKKAAAEKAANAISNEGVTVDGEFYPLGMDEIIGRILRATDNWPRRVGAALFAHDGASPEVYWINAQDALFGWVGSKVGAPPDWHRKVGYHSRGEVFEELRRRAFNYESIEHFPHEPVMPGHYYTCGEYEPGDGSTLVELVGRFNPLTDHDSDLLIAMLLTLAWGGPGGARPAFVVTSPDGRGAGKSKLTALLSSVFGGEIDISANEQIDQIKLRLLSPEAAHKRVAKLDNVKSFRFSSAELEALITTPVVNGRRLYHGDCSRPNTLTWFLTLNGVSLGTDMSQRSVIVKIAKPAHTGDWEESTASFIASNRRKIIADCIGLLRGPKYDLQRYTRWGLWEREVLSRLPACSELQSLILARQEECNVEQEESEQVEVFFRDKLERLQYRVDFEEVFIPSKVAAFWYQHAIGERRMHLSAASRALKQRIEEGGIGRLMYCRSHGDGRGFLWRGESWKPEHGRRMDLQELIREKREGWSSEWSPFGDS